MRRLFLRGVGSILNLWPAPRTVDDILADFLPADWDGESYCCADGCTNPATHELLNGMADATPVVELVCCRHAGGAL